MYISSLFDQNVTIPPDPRLVAQDETRRAEQLNQPKNLLNKIYSADNSETAIDLAKKYVIGTWTYTGQDTNIGGVTFWHRWIVKEDGTMEVYLRPATADDWGTPKIKHWKIGSSKYTDTGKRYYTFHLDDDWAYALITLDGFFYKLPDTRIEMEKTDRFPFSK